MSDCGESSAACSVGIDESSIDQPPASRVDTVDRSTYCAIPRQGIDKDTSCTPECADKSVGTDEIFESHRSLQLKIEKLTEQNSFLTNKLSFYSSPAARMKDDDEQTLFLTGIPSYEMFDSLLNMLLPLLKVPSCLFAHDQLLLVLMKLRLATPLKDLSYRFNISISQVSVIFHLWLDVMSRELKQLIVWPDRGIIMKTYTRMLQVSV